LTLPFCNLIFPGCSGECTKVNGSSVGRDWGNDETDCGSLCQPPRERLPTSPAPRSKRGLPQTRTPRGRYGQRQPACRMPWLSASPASQNWLKYWRRKRAPPLSRIDMIARNFLCAIFKRTTELRGYHGLHCLMSCPRPATNTLCRGDVCWRK